jgi:Na+/H+ antiporter NhaD/arsenite permease-like protein
VTTFTGHLTDAQAQRLLDGALLPAEAAESEAHVAGCAECQALVFSGFSVAASQVVSNVPFVILAGQWIPRLADPRLLWLATALAATLAGNLTVVGSVANIIVLELAGSRGRIGFWRFFRIGAVVTSVTLVAALGILLAERAAGLL